MERPKATKRLTKLRRRIADRMYPVKQIYLPARMYYNTQKRMSQLRLEQNPTIQHVSISHAVT